MDRRGSARPGTTAAVLRRRPAGLAGDPRAPALGGLRTTRSALRPVLLAPRHGLLPERAPLPGPRGTKRRPEAPASRPEPGRLPRAGNERGRRDDRGARA